MELDASGSALSAITDKGDFITARLTRRDGHVRAVELEASVHLRDDKGAPLQNEMTDSEGLVVDDAGRITVSFEQRHRVVTYAAADAPGRTLPALPDVAQFDDNTGFEALAQHPDGTLYTLPERDGTAAESFGLLAFDGQSWRHVGDIPRRRPFLPVGADFDAQGRLYLLERTFTPLGFRSRIRRFDLTAPDFDEVTLATTSPGQNDNLEGIAVWSPAPDDIRLTLISDDNFLWVQHTQLVDYAVTE